MMAFLARQIHKIVGDGKRFIAYQIVSRLNSGMSEDLSEDR